MRCVPPGTLESRTWIVEGAVAISTQFEPSPLYVDLCQWSVCTVALSDAPDEVLDEVA